MNAFGRLGHETVRGAAQHVEPRRRDQLRELLGVAERGERVLRAGDDERRRRDLRELEPQLVAGVEDRVDLRDERVRLRSARARAASTFTNTPKRRCRRGPIIQRMRVVHQAGHAALVDDVRPLREQLAAPLVVLARGAREREGAHPVGVQHADDLRDDTAHRRADDVRALDALGVEHRDRVGGHAHEVVRAGRRVGVTGAAVVGRDAAVAAAERAPLQRPAAVVDAEALDHQDRRTVATTPRAVRDVWCHRR